MSVNKTHPLSISPSSQSSLNDRQSRPTTSSRPSDQSVRTSDDHPIDEAPHASPITSPTHARAPDEPGHDDSAEHNPGVPHQPFQPFFTLIEDAHTSDHHHPTVHYIFSDDDTDIVTEAALRSLEAQHDAVPGSKRADGRTTNPSHNPAEHTGNDSSALLPPPIPGVRDNYIVLDVEPVTAPQAGITPPEPYTTAPSAGGTKSISTSPANPSTLATQHPPPGPNVPRPQYRVTSAKSFSSTWQVLSSEMVAAPTFENHDPSDAPGHGLMLKIYGTAGIPGEGGKERGTPRLEDMMDQFAKRMRELQMVIDAADVAAPEAGEGEGAQDEESQGSLGQKIARDEHTAGDEAAKQGGVRSE